MNIGTSKAYPFHNDGGDEDDDSVHAQMDTILTTLVMPLIISKEVKAFAKCVSLNPGGVQENSAEATLGGYSASRCSFSRMAQCCSTSYSNGVSEDLLTLDMKLSNSHQKWTARKDPLQRNLPTL